MDESQTYSPFRSVLLREWWRMTSRRLYFGVCIVLPLFTLFFMATIFGNGQMENIPIGIVDQDNTATSRTIVRNISAVPTFKVTKHFVNEAAARESVQKKEIYGYLSIPPQFEQNAITGKNATLSYYYHYALMSVGGELMAAFEYELNTYMNEIYNSFSSYAAIRRIEYTYESTFSYMNVSFDKEKMDSILKNIISNSLKYTPENGKVSISVSDTNDSWKVIIKDTGIGIPASEQSKLFKLHFRASNAINSKVTGSGIGLMLVGKLVSLHGGKISVDSVEHQGTTIKIVFPKKNKTSQSISDEASSKFEALAPVLPAPNVPAKTTATIDNPNLRRILVVEDNDELRSYLVSSLSSIYNVQACANGKEALIIIKEYWPELVLSDIMMPEMRGDELCVAIKSDIEISHIPVLLLTALGEENNILDGLSIGADEYLIKPFSVKILRANIANLLANRELLRMRYANLDIEAKSMVPSANGTNSLDWKFISNVKKIVDENINNPEFSVNVLCESSGMSRTSFYCKLKALTGQSPTEFIRGMRLKRATELLKEGEYAINEISDMVGFSETKYFREVFKKYYKMSPSRYAKEGGNPSAELEDDEED